MLLQVHQMRCGYGKKNPVEIVHGITFSISKPEFVCIIGPNGCGKTTALKAIMGLLPLMGGDVLMNGVSVTEMKEKERAKRFAYIPQAHTPPFPFIVSDVVMLGRTPYISTLSKTTEYDRAVAYATLELLGIEHLSDKAYTELSGGQQQLVLIARALAQQSDILIMDEPTAALDFGNQQLVLSRMRMLAEMGKTVIMVTHDPDHALYVADRVIVMDDGVIISEGTAEETITTKTIHRIYNTDARVLDVEVLPGHFEKVCVPIQTNRR